MKSNFLSVRIDSDRRDEIQAAAIRRGVNISTIVREAIDAYEGADCGRSSDVARARKYLGRRARR